MKGEIIAFIDGSCEPINPGGSMGIGCVISVDGSVEVEHSEKFPANRSNTNNIAEYKALEFVLSWCITEGVKDYGIVIYSDSNLVINQMVKAWKIKGGFYAPYAIHCDSLVEELIEMGNKFRFQWISRDKNTVADELSKRQHTEIKDYKKQKLYPYLRAV